MQSKRIAALAARSEFGLLLLGSLGTLALPTGRWMFGAMLYGWVLMRFHRRLRQEPGMEPRELRTFTRHLSRLIYLLLYLMMLFSLGLRWLRPEDFQVYLVHGVLALVAIHALGSLCRHLPAQCARLSGAASRKRSAEVA
jgi:hypothetical protein